MISACCGYDPSKPGTWKQSSMRSGWGGYSVDEWQATSHKGRGIENDQVSRQWHRYECRDINA